MNIIKNVYSTFLTSKYYAIKSNEMKAFEIDRHSFIFDDNNEHRKRAILDMNGDIKHIFSNYLMMYSIEIYAKIAIL